MQPRNPFAVPAFGVKIDAVPGRINETWVRITKKGTFYGQCSEICGVRHYKMPIEVKVVSQEEFARFIASGGVPEDKFAKLDVDGAAAVAAAND